MQWYYANDGQRQGPVAEDEFARLVGAGEIRPETLVWRAGMATWRPYADIAQPPPMAAAGTAPAPAGMAPAPDASGGPTTLRPGVAIQGYGGFWRRLLAKLIDGLLVNVASWVVLVPIYFTSLGRAGLLNPGAQPSPEQMMALLGLQAISMAVTILIGLTYSVLFIRKFAATPGKLALGLRIYRADSQPLSIPRIIARYFAEWVSGVLLLIGYLIVAFDAEKRALHDHMVDTRVVRVGS